MPKMTMNFDLPSQLKDNVAIYNLFFRHNFKCKYLFGLSLSYQVNMPISNDYE